MQNNAQRTLPDHRPHVQEDHDVAVKGIGTLGIGRALFDTIWLTCS